MNFMSLIRLVLMLKLFQTELGAGGNAALGPRPSPAGMQAHLSGQRGALALSFLEKNNAAGVVEAFGRLLA